MECQFEDESQQDTNKTDQSWMHQQYIALVQQRMEREMEAAQLQRRVSVLGLFLIIIIMIIWVDLTFLYFKTVQSVIYN
jgi:hypothetical protein